RSFDFQLRRQIVAEVLILVTISNLITIIVNYLCNHMQILHFAVNILHFKHYICLFFSHIFSLMIDSYCL
ncbi:MAG: hypothetical protein RR338_06550, partial [Clostridia bacterium]